jgi:glycine/D-amino acid oxidase-like deaminating enzyme
MEKRIYEFIVLGAGIYGLYAAKLLAEKGVQVAVAEYDNEPFQRASYVNQARVHNGYHYPRSVSTAKKSAKYYQRFNEEFSFAVINRFKKIYAISAVNSLTNAAQFARFCDFVCIPCEEINPNQYFNKGAVEAAFETTECAFDALLIKNWFLDKLTQHKNVDIFYQTRGLSGVSTNDNGYKLIFNNGLQLHSSRILNATYAGVNQVLDKFGFNKFKIKYEICEIILVDVCEKMKNVGITVMDGPFFSVMPFDLSGRHSITSVAFTPHRTSREELPTFNCQSINPKCTSENLENCNLCPAKPSSAWKYMNQIAKKYLEPSIKINYTKSLFAIKPILYIAT